VGTVTIEKSELLSKMLKKEGIKHEVLNAKQHEREAEIIAQAGRLGSVTIATNMAGRGTDIVLGGNPEYMAKQDMKKKGYDDEVIALVDSFYDTDDENILEARKVYQELVDKYEEITRKEHEKVVEAGGLHIIGTERHESRRIDNQLRGRSGRQGDPGSSRFYISLEDDLMRLFAGERIKGLMESANMPDDEPLEHSLLTRTIENAQKKVEGNNFSIRKHVLKYDDVMNKQREIIYKERRRVLEGENLKDHILEMVKNLVESNVEIYTRQAKYPEEWDLEGLEIFLEKTFGMKNGVLSKLDIESLTKEKLIDYILDKANEIYSMKEQEFGEETFREIERIVLLQIVDSKWMDHIDAMDQLKQGIGLRSMGQEDPVRAYQIEGFDMFEEMTTSIWEDTVQFLFHAAKSKPVERKRVANPLGIGNSEGAKKPVVNKTKKVGRNDPCPCGSGKKYKKCCGAPDKENAI
jgi:preprotein translocase subunit SecA